jgi:hypothetical protein
MSCKIVDFGSGGNGRLRSITTKALKMNYLNGNLILRYLSQQCSTQECDQVREWLGESPQNQNTFNYLKMVVSQLN